MGYRRWQNDSDVFGWFEIPHDATEICDSMTGPTLHRRIHHKWAVDAAVANNVPLNRFPRRILFFDGNGNHGGRGRRHDRVVLRSRQSVGTDLLCS